jgi:Tfp pilus assembly protein PilX
MKLRSSLVRGVFSALYIQLSVPLQSEFGLRAACEAMGLRPSNIWRDQSGQSLLLALIVMAALSITVTAVAELTTSSETFFGRDRDSERAFATAEAGVANGFSVIMAADPKNQSNIARLPATGAYSFNIDGSAGSYYGTKSGSTWTVTGTGTSPNGKVVRRVSQTMFWQTTSAPGDLEDPYSYGLFIDNSGGNCAKIHGNVSVAANVWISGALCPNGGVSINPVVAHAYSVYIGDQYEGANNSSLGTSALPFATARIVGNCSVQGKGAICSDSSQSNVYADSYPATGSSLVKPTIDAPSIYASGNWNSPTCSPGTFQFDNDSASNQSVGTVNLFRGASFDCTVTDGSGVTVGRLAWDKTTSTLTVNGTIFIDGNIALSDSGNYTGNGTIYANGTINGSGQVVICGPSGPSTPATGYGCPHTWNPQLGNLGLVAINPAGQTPAFNAPSGGELDATVVVNGSYVNSGSMTVLGPTIADSADIGGTTGAIIPAAPPNGAPPVDTSKDVGWTSTAGSWSQLN